MWSLISMIAGTIIMCLFGVVRLMNWAKIGLDKAIVIGALPFISGDLLKMSATYIDQRVEKALPNLMPVTSKGNQ
ncbi:MAG: biotin transporter BioY [Candidatus Bathyarchaeia archaeon]